MPIPTTVRNTIIALIALLGAGLQEARADSGRIVLTIYKAAGSSAAPAATAR